MQKRSAQSSSDNNGVPISPRVAVLPHSLGTFFHKRHRNHLRRLFSFGLSNDATSKSL